MSKILMTMINQNNLVRSITAIGFVFNLNLLEKEPIIEQEILTNVNEESIVFDDTPIVDEYKLELEKIERQAQVEVIEEVEEWIDFNGSYYTPYCKGCSGITFSGYDVRNTIYYNGLRIIATDNRIIKLYSIVEVKTPNETFKAIVLDRGGAIKNFKVDILVRTTKEALELGRHTVSIRILEEGK